MDAARRSASRRSATCSASPRGWRFRRSILMMMFGQTRIFFVMSARRAAAGEALLEGPSEATTRPTSSRSSPASVRVALLRRSSRSACWRIISNSGTLFAFADGRDRGRSSCASTDPDPPPTRSAPRRSTIVAPVAASSAASTCICQPARSETILMFVDLGRRSAWSSTSSTAARAATSPAASSRPTTTTATCRPSPSRRCRVRPRRGCNQA